MNRKISRKKKHKYSNEEKLALGEDENKSTLINIVQEDDSNVFELLQSLRISHLRFIILKCSRFWLLVIFIFILFLLFWYFFQPTLPFHTCRLLQTSEYNGEKGEKLIKSLNKHVKQVLPKNHLSRHAFSSKKVGSFFNIKDQTKLEHINDLTCLVKCPENTCWKNYLGETASRVKESVLEYAGKDKKSHMRQHTLQSGHSSVSLNEFKLLGKGFDNNRLKRKVSETLLGKKYWPTLSTQENS